MLLFNRPQFMGRAIQSILDQSITDWELIVVQDGRNDQISALMEQWVQRDSRIRYFHRPQAGNIAQASNFGLSQSRGTYIAIQDDDDYWIQNDKLQKQIRFLDSHLDYTGCSGGVVVIDQRDREKMRYLKPEHDGDIKRGALLANPMCHSAGMYRLETARLCGGYDETLPGFQDWDLWLKLGLRGKLYNFPEYFTAYRVWEGAGTFHQQRVNTTAAIRILWHHRKSYRGFIPAMTLFLAYYVYARTPVVFRRRTWTLFAGLKRRMFSARQE
ncbi:MAG: glycosyltransferase family 2 protein [Verrucomicrobiota bacterium]